MVQIQPINTGLPVETVTQILIRVGSFDTDATSTQLYFAAQTSGGTMVDEGNLVLSGSTFAGFLNASGTTITDIEDYTLNYLGVTRL